MIRTRENLLEIAGRHAAEHQSQLATIVKEILHYEILYVLGASGALKNLVFQGGTCLRLCHGGNRYSEDLDFVSVGEIDYKATAKFEERLRGEIAAAYGLKVTATHKPAQNPEKRVGISRVTIKVELPAENRSHPQKHIIRIEMAAVPSYDHDLLPVRANYPHLPSPLRSMMLFAETQEEILADKVIAMGARDYIKYRDIWDLKFLQDRNIQLNLAWVEKKLLDYGIARGAFIKRLTERSEFLTRPEAARGFLHEMSRFLDRDIATKLTDPAAAQRCCAPAIEYAGAACKTLGS
ncbi:MAG: nucleotidyl transferase AbiEii/AbiGii toxin family protein [Nevskiales bacterium]